MVMICLRPVGKNRTMPAANPSAVFVFVFDTLSIYNPDGQDTYTVSLWIDGADKKQLFTVRDIRLPSRCKRHLHSSGLLSSVDCSLVTDVSGQPTGPIFKGQAYREDWQLKMGRIACTETSVTNYKSMLRNIPEERRVRLFTDVIF